MLILGINGCEGAFHDASASLVENGQLLASAEEERFNRVKHSQGVPKMAAARLLLDLGKTIQDVDAVGFYLDPWLMFRHYFLTTVRDHFPESFGLFQAFPTYLGFLDFRKHLRIRIGVPPKTPIYYVRHHLCHAASAFYQSPFEEAAVLVIDGSGEREASSSWVGRNTGLSQLGAPMAYPHSIGFFYHGIAEHLGLGGQGGAGKLMGLAPFGKPEFYDSLRKWVKFESGGGVSFDLRKMSFFLNQPFFTPDALAELGPRRLPEAPLLDRHANIAASAQKILEEAVLHMACSLREKTRLSKLCYAGGVALNIDANSEIAERAGFKDIYIPAPAHDGGTSVGAALAVDAHLRPKARRSPTMVRADLGTQYNDRQIVAAIEQAGLRSRQLAQPQLQSEVAQALAKNAVVGWYKGRMEYGPRALGFRSILANPGPDAMRDYINLRIKGREPYRPLAPTILWERADDVIEAARPSPFMLYRFLVRPEWTSRLKAVTHVDGSARAQTVTQDENPDFHRLISEFDRLTGVPVLLNTSFNLAGEVLVETPEQAIQAARTSGIDVLVLGDHVLTLTERPGFLDFQPPAPPPVGTIWEGGVAHKKSSNAAACEPPIRQNFVWRLAMSLITRYSAATVARLFYSPKRLAILAGILWLGNKLDRRVLGRR